MSYATEKYLKLSFFHEGKVFKVFGYAVIERKVFKAFGFSRLKSI